MDPLTHLPPELVLRILRHTTLSGIANLAQCSRPWHIFIDQVHSEQVYFEKAERPPNCRDLSFLDKQESYVQYMKDVTTWKGLCRKQTLLRKNITQDEARLQEAFIQIEDAPVWRFRPDFEHRFFISTAQTGGLYVTDMDSGKLLWSISSSWVRPCAHLEYSEGYIAFDRNGDAIEIWKHSPDVGRGHFAKVVNLPHDVETRGFHLIYPILCVVSTQGKAFTYDLSSAAPRLVIEFPIEENAVGHLTQNATVVAITMGRSGFHFFDKHTGKPLGVLDQHQTPPSNIYHIQHSEDDSALGPFNELNIVDTIRAPLPMAPPTSGLLTRREIHPGPRPNDNAYPHWPRLPLAIDEWGAGLLQDKKFVGISRGGRCLICADYEAAIQSPFRAADLMTIVECRTDPSMFDFGGWLAFKHDRVLFEAGDKIYLLTLNDSHSTSANTDNTTNTANSILKTAQALPLYSSRRLRPAVSWMGIFSDCIMCTCGVVTMPRRDEDFATMAVDRTRTFVTKAMRVVSWAPDEEGLGEPSRVSQIQVRLSYN